MMTFARDDTMIRYDVVQESTAFQKFKKPYLLTAQGVRISEEMKALAVGTINVFFDMPADLDISQAAVNIVE